MNYSRRRFTAGAALLAGASLFVAAPGPLWAQAFPTKPVRIVVGFPPGGGGDFAARAIQVAFSKALGQPVMVDNRAGANGTIGATAVARSEPDGYTVFVTTAGTVSLSPSLMKGLGFDPIRDLAPVGRVLTNTTMFVINPGVPARTMRELVDQSRKTGTKPTIASSGNGSMPHMAIELLSASAGVPFTHVPYRGAGPALSDVLGGQVQGFVADVPVVLQSVKAGKLRAVGVAGRTRSPVLPDVETLAEQGFADTNAENWYGMFAPAKTPPAIIDTLNKALIAALADPDTQEKLRVSGVVPTPSSPAELGTLLHAEIARWSKLIADRQITGD